MRAADVVRLRGDENVGVILLIDAADQALVVWEDDLLGKRWWVPTRILVPA